MRELCTKISRFRFVVWAGAARMLGMELQHLQHGGQAPEMGGAYHMTSPDDKMAAQQIQNNGQQENGELNTFFCCFEILIMLKNLEISRNL